MRRTVHPKALHLTSTGVFVGLILLGAACATKVDVTFDERSDFSHYQTWNWHSRGSARVDAPGGAAPALEAHLARIIEAQLRERGFARTRRDADFTVSYHLSVRPRAVVVNQAFAPYLLSSMNSGASYWVEGSDTQTRMHKDFRLTIGMIEGAGITWKARLEERVEGDADLPLEESVAALLERFPRHESRNDEAEQR